MSFLIYFERPSYDTTIYGLLSENIIVDTTQLVFFFLLNYKYFYIVCYNMFLLKTFLIHLKQL